MKLNEELLDKVVGGALDDDMLSDGRAILEDARQMLCARCPATFSYPAEGSGTIVCPNCGYPNTYDNP